MPNKPVATIRQLQIVIRGKKRRDFRLHCAGQKLPRHLPQNACQRVVDHFRLAKLG